jgi:translation initiation factor 1
MSNKDRVLVYSDDPKDKALLDGSAQKNAVEIQQKKIIQSNQFTAVFRIEKNGRGGKIVTVLDQLPAHEKFLKELTKEFKVRCGVGGTYQITGNIGVIEVQGDNRDKMKQILDQKNIKFKGV